MLEGIDWRNAAIIAAVVAGVFAVIKSLVEFLLGLATNAISERRRRRTIKARLAQFYFQTAAAGLKALGAQAATIEAKSSLGLPLAAERVPVEFFSYEDEDLLRDVVVLADEVPDAVTALVQAQDGLETLKRAARAEEEQFGDVSFYYSYPRSRRLAWGVIDHAIKYLHATAKILPENGMNPERGARAAYLRAFQELDTQLEGFPSVSQEEVQEEGLAALAKLHNVDAQS